MAYSYSPQGPTYNLTLMHVHPVFGQKWWAESLYVGFKEQTKVELSEWVQSYLCRQLENGKWLKF